jgi:hypothetical protein
MPGTTRLRSTIVVAAATNAFAPDNMNGLPGTSLFYPHTFNAGLASVAFSMLIRARSWRDGRSRSTATPIATACSAGGRAAVMAAPWR